MKDKLFTNITVFDGTSPESYPAEVLVSGNRIKTVAKETGQLSRDDVDVIDGNGATMMPGMINTHSHISFNNGADAAGLAAFPEEETVLTAVRNAELVHDYGFTAVVSAASVKPRTDIVVRNEINAGRIPGPRMLAGTPEFTVTAGLCDEYHLWGHEKPGPSIVCDTPDEFRKWVRLLVREGVDVVKFNNSGDSFVGREGASGEANPMTDEEVLAIVDTAKRYGRRLAAHSHADNSVRQCMQHEVQFIYHATYAKDDTIDKLAGTQMTHYITPGLGIRYSTTYEAEDWGITEEVAAAIGTKREFEIGCETMAKMHKAGVKVLPYGDYGFAWTPHGTENKDLDLMVRFMGFSNWEALRAATAYGGEAWAGDTGEKLGQVKEGFLADLLLIDGDPVKDLSLLLDIDKILMVMKDGAYHRAPTSLLGAGKQVAAE